MSSKRMVITHVMGRSRKIVVGVGLFVLAACALRYIGILRYRKAEPCYCPADNTLLHRDTTKINSISLRDLDTTKISSISLRDLKYEGIHQDDDRLHRFIGDHVIALPPTRKTLILEKSDKTYFAQVEQDKKIDVILGGKRNGFFIEVGGDDGESNSNTLFFERERNWSGLLIEPDPDSYRKLLSKNRNVYSVEGCVSMTNRTQSLKLHIAGALTTFVDGIRKVRDPNAHIGTVQCYPLWAILRAIGRTHVDLLSLDVEGAEVDVLRTIPFDKLTIDMLTIEYQRHGDSEEFIKEHRQRIANFMVATGKYKKVAEAKPLDDIYQLIT